MGDVGLLCQAQFWEAWFFWATGVNLFRTASAVRPSIPAWPSSAAIRPKDSPCVDT